MKEVIHCTVTNHFPCMFYVILWKLIVFVMKFVFVFFILRLILCDYFVTLNGKNWRQQYYVRFSSAKCVHSCESLSLLYRTVRNNANIIWLCDVCPRHTPLRSTLAYFVSRGLYLRMRTTFRADQSRLAEHRADLLYIEQTSWTRRRRALLRADLLNSEYICRTGSRRDVLR